MGISNNQYRFKNLSKIGTNKNKLSINERTAIYIHSVNYHDTLIRTLITQHMESRKQLRGFVFWQVSLTTKINNQVNQTTKLAWKYRYNLNIQTEEVKKKKYAKIYLKDLL